VAAHFLASAITSVLLGFGLFGRLANPAIASGVARWCR
jgi:hypothetical protein